MLLSKKQRVFNCLRLSTTDSSIRPDTSSDTSSHTVTNSHTKLEPDSGKKGKNVKVTTTEPLVFNQKWQAEKNS
jgi:hypothetical protein